MIITYDPVADAIYVRLADAGVDVGVGETLIDVNGIVVDTDGEGNPRGFEFLDVKLRGVPLETVPSNVAAALRSFIAAGSLASLSPVESEFS